MLLFTAVITVVVVGEVSLFMPPPLLLLSMSFVTAPPDRMASRIEPWFDVFVALRGELKGEVC